MRGLRGLFHHPFGWRGAMVLVVAVSILLLSVGAALQRAREQFRLEAGSQRVSIWFSTQSLVELHRFTIALHNFGHGEAGWDKDRLLERYEVLLSRLPLLTGSEEAETATMHDQVDLITGLQQALELAEPDILALRPGDAARFARIEAVLQEGDRMLTLLNLALHTERRQAVEQARDSSHQLGLVFLASLAGLLFSVLLLLWLIARGGQRAAAAERTLRVLVDSLPLSISAFDREGRLVLVNEACIRFARLEGVAMVLGRQPAQVGYHAHIQHDIGRVMATGQALPPREMILRAPEGEERTLMVSTAPVYAGDALVRVVRVALDVTDQRRADRRIRHLAEHDSLTDLPNRLLFGSRLQAVLARATPEAMVAVHCIDLDQFKEVNDSLGHPMGDQLLLAVASRMRGVIRDGDMLARLGGDEFAVIQPGLRSEADAGMLAARLNEVLARPYRLQGHMLRSGASIGTALAPQHGSSVEVMLSRADIALYRAKASGRGRTVLFAPEQEETLRERRQMEEDLRQALARDELFLAFQPKFCIASGRMSGCEALLRWQHPDRGLIPPGRFIPVAEESGLIHPITRHVLHLACRQAMEWRARGLELQVAVNLSAGHFDADQGLRLVEEALAKTGCDPRLLEVEVTEGLFLRCAETARRNLEALRALGVRIALDDFGTGYSSLGYLQHLAFDVIKLDRSFIMGLGEPVMAASGPGRQIVDAIMRLAHGLGAEVVAEGVETQAQLDILHQMGCDHVQGFLLGRPMQPGALFDMARGQGLAAARESRSAA